MEKQCFKCGKTKLLTEFYRQAKMADGRLNKCKACTRNDVKENRENNIERYRLSDQKRNKLPYRVAARKAYAQTEKGRAAGARAKAAWIERNADKRAAHVILGNAIRNGRVTKPEECEKCGANGRIHGHHHDYTRPLEVKWLCASCHTKEHKMDMSEGEKIVEEINKAINGKAFMPAISALAACFFAVATQSDMPPEAKEVVTTMVYDLMKNIMRANGVSEERFSEIMAGGSTDIVAIYTGEGG